MREAYSSAHCTPFQHLSVYTVVNEALEAANYSYSPYSDTPSGVAIELQSGEIYRGSYLENAGHNPSLSPLQGALIALIADGKKYDQIKQVALVERKGAPVIQKETARNLVKQLAPESHFYHEFLDQTLQTYFNLQILPCWQYSNIH